MSVGLVTCCQSHCLWLYAFADEQAALDAKQAELETAEATLAEMVEEQSGDDGVFADFDKVNKKEVNARIKEIKGNAEFVDELSVLNDWTNKTKRLLPSRSK